MKTRKTKPPVRGGYVKKQPLQLKPQKPPEPPKPKKPRIKPPPGINEALQAMGELARELQNIATESYTVSIDALNGQWVLVVRGWEPYFDSWGGYTVRHIPSTLVSPPRSKRR